MTKTNKPKTLSCGHGSEKKNKLSTTALPPSSKKNKTIVLKKTQLQLEKEQRDKNRELVKTMVEKAKLQWLQKFPPQQNMIKTPKHKGLFFPLNQETERIKTRQKVIQNVGKVKKTTTK